MKSKILGITLIVFGIIILGLYSGRDLLLKQIFSPQPQPNAKQLLPEASPAATITSTVTQEPIPPVETVVDNLSIPWELEFLPNGDLLVTERPGTLLRIGSDKSTIPVQGVEHVGEGGLLGMTLHPNFEKNNFIYLYVTTRTDAGLTNRVERYELTNNQLTDRSMIIEDIPGATYHDGGRIAFGPDGMLYITTGDAGEENSAQDIQSLAGKILRLNDDGSIPEDNPFKSPVYSYGHRNPQGLAWDTGENLWATEHGRSGTASGFDELNLIKPGKNYGWPIIQGDEERDDMQLPVAHSGSSVTWAPSGMTYFNESLLFAGLRGESIYKVELDNPSTVIPYVADEFGRLRTIKVGPDGLLYVLTNNQDGRGEPRPNDDKIIRLNPDLLY